MATKKEKAYMDNIKHKKQKVLIVHNYYQIPGGEDTVVANEKQMLEEHGHEVVLYSRSNSELKEMGKLHKLLLPFIAVYNPKTYKDIKSIIKKQKIDIVHVHNTLTLISPSVYYAALRCKVSVVQTMHNFRLLCPGATFYRNGHICEDCVEHGLMCAIKHNCYRDSRLQTLACVINTKLHRMLGVYGKINYICLTEFNKEKLLNLKQIKENRVFVKSNYTKSLGMFIPAEQRKEQFVYAGRLDKLKGIYLLLESWKKMESNAPKLIICGTGSMEAWCKAYITEHRINVEMLGVLSNPEVKALIANSKALILPSQSYEGFPMSLIESYSVGTPVIGSNIGNTGNLIIENITGYKLNSNPDALINAIGKMDSKIFMSTYQTYNECYTEEENYKVLKNIYDFMMK